MKKIALLWVVVTALIACNQDVMGPLYSGVDGSGNDGFAFAASVLNLETGTEDRNTIRVPIYRGKTSTSIVNLTLDFETKVPKDSLIGDSIQTVMVDSWVERDPQGIFSLATQRVVFGDDANVAYAQITYPDINELSLTEKYKMRLRINDGASPSRRDKTMITLSRRLTFDSLGVCTYADSCLFEKSYKAPIYKAREAEVYRIMDPYTKGLLDEGYAEAGLMTAPCKYVQITVNADKSINFEPINTGMLVPANYGGKVQEHLTWGYHPTAYMEAKPDSSNDFSRYAASNRKLSDKELLLYPVYCMPTLYYGFISFGQYVGAFPLYISLP